MKPNLLNDILEEGDYQQFRDDLRARFRAESRQRRQRKITVFAVTAMAASIAIVATLALIHGKKNPGLALKNETIPTVRSAPLQAAELLVTEPTRVDVVESPAMVITFTTAANPELQSIDDSQLLAIFSDHPAGLVQTSTGEHLVFIDPADSQKFMGSN